MSNETDTTEVPEDTQEMTSEESTSLASVAAELVLTAAAAAAGVVATRKFMNWRDRRKTQEVDVPDAIEAASREV